MWHRSSGNFLELSSSNIKTHWQRKLAPKGSVNDLMREWKMWLPLKLPAFNRGRKDPLRFMHNNVMNGSWCDLRAAWHFAEKLPPSSWVINGKKEKASKQEKSFVIYSIAKCCSTRVAVHFKSWDIKMPQNCLCLWHSCVCMYCWHCWLYVISVWWDLYNGWGRYA